MRDDGRPDSAPARDEDDIDYYDWKARYRGWAGIGMMRPALVAAGILAVLVLILIGFVFHPIW